MYAHRVCFFLVKVNSLVPVALEASIIARDVGAQLLIPSKCCVGT